MSPMRRPSLLPFVSGVLAVGIFIFDTLSPLQFAVAALYVVVVLLAASHGRRQGILFAATASAALTVLSFLLQHGLLLAGTAPLRCVVSLAAIGTTTFLALRNLSAAESLRETERRRANLARFFSPQLIDQMMENDAPLCLALYQPAAVLFVDIVGFTAYCSRMPPDALIALLRELLALLSDAVFAHNGTIDKFLGDGLMAVFGSPMPTQLDATNATRCALDMLQRTEARPSPEPWMPPCRSRRMLLAVTTSPGSGTG